MGFYTAVETTPHAIATREPYQTRVPIVVGMVLGVLVAAWVMNSALNRAHRAVRMTRVRLRAAEHGRG